MDDKWRILVVGASESNRRRPLSLGAEVNQSWAKRVEQRNDVCGYWPTFFMHALDARNCGSEPPDKDALRDFGTGRYLYDRSLIYEWDSALLWNVAMPANVARFGLYYLSVHRELFRVFSPDIIVLCLGSVDCLEFGGSRASEDILELGQVEGLVPGESLQFDYCSTAEEFYDVMHEVAETITWINQDAIVVHLDAVVSPRASRRIIERIRSFNEAARCISREFSFKHVSHPLLEKSAGDALYHWLRRDDNHPTDAMNAELAKNILRHVPLGRPARFASRETPVPVLRVSDWTKERRI
ncbi:hypothetical protein [uncultured Pseudodesulfovibrio sp.]|uniref:hypothetical protein n=1 Tax=uncultured Pseudodesulfovibrio sp. TaxID=2035858 RepID=UPI0029C87D02|nr:hypothetical protein [uncultured Pseudodesulfovibrio sp.]